MGGSDNLSPAMRQYKHFKKKYPDCLLLFRMGDFYEMFYEDAILASKVLGIALTSRGKGEHKAPLAGIPHRSAATYIQRLITAGIKLAIAEQVEDPKTVKGRIVERDVVRIITPGTIEEGLLDQKSNNFIIALFQKGEEFGIAAADITTGDFFCCTAMGSEKAIAEIVKLKPAECVLPESLAVNKPLMKFLEENKIFISKIEDFRFELQETERILKEHFQSNSLKGFGIQDKPLLIIAAGGLMDYLQETQKQSLHHISRLYTVNLDDHMVLDAVTIRNLEIFENIIDKSSKHTLLNTLDSTLTSMGGRLIKMWLQRPLLDIKRIKERQTAIGVLVNKALIREELRDELKETCDIERIVGKLSYSTITPKDVVGLAHTLKKIPGIMAILNQLGSDFFSRIATMPDMTQLAQRINAAIVEEPPLKTTEGGIIKRGINPELDELRTLKESSKEVLKKIEQEEQLKTGIKTLRLRFNRVIGYYIQVSKSYLHLVPEHYRKKQTLVGGERYITEKLKLLESRILGAEERINILEYELFKQIVGGIETNSKALQLIGRRLGVLDVIASLAMVAERNRYTKPEINLGGELKIINGKHAVVEKIESQFIPNDTHMGPSEMIILTGPNMAGKSTYMRQVCLIVLLAQIGSFVPAESAKIGIIDRIFTRVGAYDDLSHGQSTFMVEMDETANILNNATTKSLIILDEVGRGTSTFDGVAIAWAVAEWLYNKARAKTIFATHYHVLNKLGEEFKNIKNYNIAVKEAKDEIIFLRKVEKGGTDKSYGIHVAKLAGMPQEVINRALEIQKRLMEEDKMLSRLKGHKFTEQLGLKEWEL